MTEDLLESSQWRPLRILLSAMDSEIASLYDDEGIEGVRTRFVGPLIRLSTHGPLTIQELASRMQVTHSAMSQTATAMRKAGLVEDAGNSDRRTRRIQLTDHGREMMPFLKAEWRATEAALRELEAELPYALSQVVRDIEQALAARGFKRRILAHLDKPRR